MRCSEASEKISQYLDGRLTSAEEAALMAHIARCARCQQEWTMLSQLSDILATPTLMTPSPDFTARLQRRLVRWQTKRKVLKGLLFFAIATVTLTVLISSYISDSVVWDLALDPSLLSSTVRIVIHFMSTLGSLGHIAILLISALISAPTVLILLVYSIVVALVVMLWARLMSRAYARFHPVQSRRESLSLGRM